MAIHSKYSLKFKGSTQSPGVRFGVDLSPLRPVEHSEITESDLYAEKQQKNARVRRYLVSCLVSVVRVFAFTEEEARCSD